MAAFPNFYCIPLLNSYNANWTELEEYSWYKEMLCDGREVGENNVVEPEEPEAGEESDEEVSDCECLSEEEAMLV
ncbi:hypothetical protein NQ314_018503 [Rhamnusium bicolor]|uniref:Uncharacterized protein n=1 Tax=Rhamnusium bicolor TaxID=1586634 RepID=A0AAV8WQR9_9CUCU|nr:hypothetical protein NQ314_018503 [Rhamnusium bicolor]